MRKVVVILGIIVVVMVVVTFLFVKRKKETFQFYEPKSNDPTGVPNIVSSRDFLVYNYLNVPVTVNIVDKHSSKPVVFVEDAKPHQTTGVTMEKVNRYLRGGNYFKILAKVDDNLIPISTYKLDYDKNETIKALHIGMVTSRWVGATQDSTFIPGLNAVQGRPWVKIHNRTDRKIILNQGGIQIPPNGFVRFKGRDHFGVRIGTIFRDTEGIYSDFKFDVPATDIYYGVTSDLQQPSFGGWQIDALFNDVPDQPQYLLENGWMGGPAHGHIKPGYIPRDGMEQFPDLNRWGETKGSISPPHTNTEKRCWY